MYRNTVEHTNTQGHDELLLPLSQELSKETKDPPCAWTSSICRGEHSSYDSGCHVDSLAAHITLVLKPCSVFIRLLPSVSWRRPMHLCYLCYLCSMKAELFASSIFLTCSAPLNLKMVDSWRGRKAERGQWPIFSYVDRLYCSRAQICSPAIERYFASTVACSITLFFLFHLYPNAAYRRANRCFIYFQFSSRDYYWLLQLSRFKLETDTTLFRLRDLLFVDRERFFIRKAREQELVSLCLLFLRLLQVILELLLAFSLEAFTEKF